MSKYGDLKTSFSKIEECFEIKKNIKTFKNIFFYLVGGILNIKV
jgi:hypothetical protein